MVLVEETQQIGVGVVLVLLKQREVLVLLFFLFQQATTQAQLQEAQLLQLAEQEQF
jgi:hypothetical protein